MDKLRAAAVQALEAIGDCSPNKALVKAAYALREALEQPNCQCGDKCFPVFSGDIEYCETCGKQTALAEQDDGSVCARCGGIVYDPVIEQAEQEPVGYVPQSVIDWLSSDERTDGAYSSINLYKNPCGSSDAPLYTHPVRTKDLTDDEIVERYGQHNWWSDPPINFARAVIEKFKEKNRG